MAIYHCSAHNVSRSSGRTATASIAYRTASQIHDHRTGITHDYTKKKGVMHTQIISNLGVSLDRSELWNKAEQAESRKDARTAKEFVIALPHELNEQQRQAVAVDFAKHLVSRYDCVADIALHAPSQAGDERNYHAHIMLTTRKAELDQQNNLVLTDKIDLELSNAKRKKLGLEPTSKEILAIRQDWERIANAHLERAGIAERIDHRSYEEIGNGKQAQIHETPQVTAMRRKGIQTNISKQNDERKAYNAQIDHQAEQDKQTAKEQRQGSLLANAQTSLQNRLQERQQARQAEQAEQQRQAQQLEQQRQQNHDRGLKR